MSTAASSREPPVSGLGGAPSPSCMSDDIPTEGCLSGEEILVPRGGRELGIQRGYKDVEELMAACDKEALAHQFVLAAQDAKIMEMRKDIETEKRERAAFECKQSEDMQQLRQQLDAVFSQYTQQIVDKLAEARDSADKSQLVVQHVRHSVNGRLLDLEQRCSSMERRIVELVDLQSSLIPRLREQHEKVSQEVASFRSGQCRVQEILKRFNHLESLLTEVDRPQEKTLKESLSSKERPWLLRESLLRECSSQSDLDLDHENRMVDMEELPKRDDRGSDMQESGSDANLAEGAKPFDIKVVTGMVKKIMDDMEKTAAAKEMLEDVTEASETTTQTKTSSNESLSTPCSGPTSGTNSYACLDLSASSGSFVVAGNRPKTVTFAQSKGSSQTSLGCFDESDLDAEASHGSFVVSGTAPKVATTAISSTTVDSDPPQRDLVAVSKEPPSSVSTDISPLMSYSAVTQPSKAFHTLDGQARLLPESHPQKPRPAPAVTCHVGLDADALGRAQMLPESHPPKPRPAPAVMTPRIHPYSSLKPSWPCPDRHTLGGSRPDRSRSARRTIEGPDITLGSRFISAPSAPRFLNALVGAEPRRADVVIPYVQVSEKPMASPSSITDYHSSPRLMKDAGIHSKMPVKVAQI